MLCRRALREDEFAKAKQRRELNYLIKWYTSTVLNEVLLFGLIEHKSGRRQIQRQENHIRMYLLPVCD